MDLLSIFFLGISCIVPLIYGAPISDSNMNYTEDKRIDEIQGMLSKMIDIINRSNATDFNWEKIENVLAVPPENSSRQQSIETFTENMLRFVRNIGYNHRVKRSAEHGTPDHDKCCQT